MDWKELFAKYSKYLFPAAIFVFSIYLIKLQLLKPLGWDEMEHIHSTYLVSLGQKPYIDFFQHHHALMWYLFSPIFLVLKDPTSLLYFFKIVGISFGFINLFLIYRLARHFVKSKYLQLLAVLICVCSYFFLQNGFEYRPDNLMFSFVIISLDLILSQKKNWAIYSGIALGFAIIVLQKAIIFVPIFAVIVIFESLKVGKLKGWKINTFEIFKLYNIQTLQPLLTFLFSILIPNFLLFTLYFSLGHWPEYWFFNWTLNSIFDDKFSAFRTIEQLNWYNQGFLIILSIVLVMSTISVIKKSKVKSQNLKLSTFNSQLLTLNFLLFTFYFLLFTLIRSPYTQYFLPLSIFGSISVVSLFELYQFKNKKLLLFSFFFFLFSLLPLNFFKDYEIKDFTFNRQVSEIQYFADNPQDNSRERSPQGIGVFIDSKEFYWFSPEAQRTIQKQKEEGKLPSSINFK